MNALNNVLFWLHLMGLVAGLGSGIALSRIGPQLATATAETRPLLWKLEHAFSRTAMGGLVALIVTGPLILWLRFNWQAPDMTLFWVKMVLVVVLVVSVAIGIRASGKAEKGDREAAMVMKRTGMTNGIVAALIVLVAVFAFNP